MNKDIALQIIAAVVVIFFLLFAANPFHLWMPTPVIMILVCVLSVSFFAFASLVWKEHSKDEREKLHSMMAGRISFLVGSTILLVAIIVKELQGMPDIWLVIALSAMIISKIIVRLLAEFRQ